MLTTNRIKPSGNIIDPEIVFVGEAPGEEEDEHETNFIGSSGQLLHRLIRSAKIDPRRCMFVNVFNQRPPKNDVGYFFKDSKNVLLTAEGMEHVETLKKELEKVSQYVKIVVAVGGVSLDVLTGNKGITKWRGSLLKSILTKETLKVYPIIHPASILRGMQDKGDKGKGQNQITTIVADINRIEEQSHTKEFPRLNYDFTPMPSVKESVEMLKGLLKRKDEFYIAVDIETIVTQKGPVMWKVGIATSSEKAIAIQFLQGGKFFMSVEEESAVVFLLSKVFKAKNIRKILQSNLYDFLVMCEHYGVFPDYDTIEDTRWLYHSYYPFTLNNLAYLTSLYTWTPYYKDNTANILGSRNDLQEGVYCCQDCVTTFEIFFEELKIAKKLGTYDNYRELISFMPSMLYMMKKGILIDVEKRTSLKEEYNKILEAMQDKVQQETGMKVNLRSAPQKMTLLYDVLGLKEQKNRKTGNRSSDADAIKKLIKKYPDNKVLFHIQKFQDYISLVDNFLSVQLSPANRVHTDFDFTNTWRLISSKGTFGWGGNLQNIPKRKKEGRILRNIFIPNKGKIFLSMDLKQAEAMVVAWDSEDIEDIEAFLTPGFDIHWEKTKEVFILDEDTKYEPETYVERYKLTMKEMRHGTKAVVHGTNYGMSESALQVELAKSDLFMTKEMCKVLLDRYKNKKPCLSIWHRGIRAKLREFGYICSPIGCRRYFVGRLTDDTFRAAYAFGPQNTVARIIQIGTREIFKKYSYIDLVHNVHDELIVEIKENDLARAVKDIKREMSIPLKIKGRTLIIPCDFSYGTSWGELKEVNGELL